MRLQDVEYDLACSAEKRTYDADRVARRVADLFQECDCRADPRFAQLTDAMLPMKHRRCNGTGVLPSERWVDLWPGKSTRGAGNAIIGLAAYLFGEEES